MRTNRSLWVSILPYGKWAEYIAEYADATIADDNTRLQIAVLSLPFQSDTPLLPLLETTSAYKTVEDGEAVYFVSVPFGNCEGCWVDADNRIWQEPSIITDNAVVAYMLGREYKQESILRVSDTGLANGTNGYLYLLKDTPANRGIALSVAGGYTGGGEYLLVASTELLPTVAIEGDYEFIPATISFLTP